MKRRGLDATLAGLATLVAAWPVSTLLVEPTWLPRTMLLLLVIGITGVGARWLALRGWQVLIVQAVCGVLTVSAVFGRGHLWHGLPTFETIRFGGTLIDDALDTIASYAAPAPTTPGMIFVVACSLALVALLVDYLAVTRRSPSMAGLPLLVAFLISAANSGSSLPAPFFLAAAAMWLVLMARQGNTILRRWGTTATVARTPVRESLDFGGVYSYASIARTLGVVALVAAVTLPMVLPQLPPKFLASGLGRNSLATGNGNGTVGFSLSLDLAADLNSSSTAPVLQYRTTDTSPPPLRVAVSSIYRSSQAVWVPGRGRLPALSTNPTIPEASGLSAQIPKKQFTMEFERNQLEEPHLAAPYPLVAANLDGVDWGLDNQTQDILVARRPESYSASYWKLEPTAAMLEQTSANPATEGNFGNNFTVDERSATPIRALSEELTAGKGSAFAKAMAIQQYLRDTSRFTYSLTLAPPATDRNGNDAGFDPLTNFLVTKTGYCVQFATAMVMMSRAAGIPARMAIGFLPGTKTDDVFSVTASDAHAWPEIYLDGIGWTRFEPTPTRAAPPTYAIPVIEGGSSGAGRAPGEETAAAPSSTASPNLGDTTTDDTTGTDLGLSLTSTVRWLTQGWGLVLLATLTGLLGSLVVPTAARWRRRRRLVTARTQAQRVEVLWQDLTSSLGDLGIPPAPSRTPRQLRAYYDHEALLEGEASAALGRVVQTLERSRYAPPAPPSFPGPASGPTAAPTAGHPAGPTAGPTAAPTAAPTAGHAAGSGQATSELAADTRQVLRAAAANRRLIDRVAATLWPSSGFAQLQSARANIVLAVTSPMRDASTVVRQRLSRRR